MAGRDADATALLTHWAQVNADNLELFDLERLEHFEPLKDAALRAICQGKEKPPPDPKNVLAILAKIAVNRSWGGDDTAYLAAAPLNEYVTALRSGDLTTAAIDGARFFIRLGNPTAEDVEIREKIKEALKTVAGDSRLNRERVIGIGVAVPDE